MKEERMLELKNLIIDIITKENGWLYYNEAVKKFNELSEEYAFDSEFKKLYSEISTLSVVYKEAYANRKNGKNPTANWREAKENHKDELPLYLKEEKMVIQKNGKPVAAIFPEAPKKKNSKLKKMLIGGTVVVLAFCGLNFLSKNNKKDVTNNEDKQVVESNSYSTLYSMFNGEIKTTDGLLHSYVNSADKLSKYGINTNEVELVNAMYGINAKSSLDTIVDGKNLAEFLNYRNINAESMKDSTINFLTKAADASTKYEQAGNEFTMADFFVLQEDKDFINKYEGMLDIIRTTTGQTQKDAIAEINRNIQTDLYYGSVNNTQSKVSNGALTATILKINAVDKTLGRAILSDESHQMITDQANSICGYNLVNKDGTLKNGASDVKNDSIDETAISLINEIEQFCENMSQVETEPNDIYIENENNEYQSTISHAKELLAGIEFTDQFEIDAANGYKIDANGKKVEYKNVTNQFASGSYTSVPAEGTVVDKKEVYEEIQDGKTVIKEEESKEGAEKEPEDAQEPPTYNNGEESNTGFEDMDGNIWSSKEEYEEAQKNKFTEEPTEEQDVQSTEAPVNNEASQTSITISDEETSLQAQKAYMTQELGEDYDQKTLEDDKLAEEAIAKLDEFEASGAQQEYIDKMGLNSTTEETVEMTK